MADERLASVSRIDTDVDVSKSEWPVAVSGRVQADPTAQVTRKLDTTDLASIIVRRGTGKPEASDILDGVPCVYFDTNTRALWHNSGQPSSPWHLITGRVYYGTAPTGSGFEAGQLWYDTAAETLKLFDGTNWIGVGGGGSSRVAVSATEPSDPDNGDLWFDSTNLQMKIRYNDAWILTLPDTARGAGDGLVLDGSDLDVNPGDGIEIDSDKVKVKAHTGITVDSNGVSVTNPFADADEAKLDGIEDGAQRNPRHVALPFRTEDGANADDAGLIKFYKADNSQWQGGSSSEIAAVEINPAQYTLAQNPQVDKCGIHRVAGLG